MPVLRPFPSHILQGVGKGLGTRYITSALVYIPHYFNMSWLLHPVWNRWCKTSPLCCCVGEGVQFICFPYKPAVNLTAGMDGPNQYTHMLSKYQLITWLAKELFFIFFDYTHVIHEPHRMIFCTVIDSGCKTCNVILKTQFHYQKHGLAIHYNRGLFVYM